MSGKLLFISHSSKDQAAVDHIVRLLEARGFRCWVAAREIKGGAPFPAAISAAIIECDACCVVMSAAADASEDVKREVALAGHHRKPIVGIRLDGSEPSLELDYFLRRVQWIDYRGVGDTAFDNFSIENAIRLAQPRTRGDPLYLAGALAIVIAAILLWPRAPLPTTTEPNAPIISEQTDTLPSITTTAAETVAETPGPDQSTITTQTALTSSTVSTTVQTVSANPPPAPMSRGHTIFQVLSIEPLSDPDQSPLVFPTAFFNRRLQQELGTASTKIDRIRLAIVFVEPRRSRGEATGGTVIGHMLVSLPSIAGCVREFGGPSYSFDNAATGLMSAINDTAPHVATWLERASNGDELTCPN